MAVEHARIVLEQLTERTAHDAVGAGLLRLLLDGVVDRQDQAAALGIDVPEVQRAMRRLKSHLDAVNKGSRGS